MSDQDNVVLITVDSLRTDYCGFTGDNGANTPALDQLAEEGLVFENAIAPGPATLDSMPIIFSGEYYPRPDPDAPISEKQEAIRDHLRARNTIPERLSRQGYETGAFTTNPWTTRQFGFDEGFDHFEDFMDVDRSDGRIDRLLDRVGVEDRDGFGADLLDLVSSWRQQNIMFQSWENFYDEIVAWTDRAEEPYFLWVFLVDAHMPFLPKNEFRSQSALLTYAANLWLYLGNERFESVFRDPLLTAYEDTVTYVDAFVDRLTDDLESDDPIYVVHGDHGEEFGEHGRYGHGAHFPEEVIRTPLVVGGDRTGEIDQLFSLADLPELLERLANGNDVADLPKPVVQTRNQDQMVGARGDGWKYVASETDRTVYRITDGHGQVETGNTDLAEVGRSLIAAWRADESERRRITEAAREVVERERV